MSTLADGLVLEPFRAIRFTRTAGLGDLLSPPYDVISPAERADLVRRDSHNVVRLILPGEQEASLAGTDSYAGARSLLDSWVDDGTLAVDDEPALYVYEMSAPDGALTRGLLGAVELRDPQGGVILPHENTMAGPVSDRLALMRATAANLEPIYLVYEGGGAASAVVASVSVSGDPIAQAQTPDGLIHRLWVLTDPQIHQRVRDDLAGRSALIADGHHRYATYRQLQAEHDGAAGPWDRGLTLLVDTSTYGPQVHPIHRVLSIDYDRAVEAVGAVARVSEQMPVERAAAAVVTAPDFAVALAQGERAVVVDRLAEALTRADSVQGRAAALDRLDVTVLHHVLVSKVWDLPDDEDHVGYAHSVVEALDAAGSDRTAVLVRATPVADVAAVAAAGERMPRKSTLFTPKPASGIVIRRFFDATS